MNSNYPMGAENDSRAPYNEIEIPLKKFDCVVSTTLSKQTSIITNEYYLEKDEEDGSVVAITDDVDWKGEYEEQHFTVPQLLEAFKCMCEDLIRLDNKTYYKKALLRKFIKECEDWTEDETEVNED